MAHVQVLDLANNRLLNLPTEMGYLANLRWFSVNENSNLKTLFPLADLGRLEYLGLRNILLDEIPEDVCTLPSITELDLRNNLQMERIPSELGQLVTLKKYIKMYLPWLLFHYGLTLFLAAWISLAIT